MRPFERNSQYIFTGLPHGTIRDIQFHLDQDDDWIKFADIIEISSEDVLYCENQSSPSQALFQLWRPQRPKIGQLADILLQLGCEADLLAIKEYVEPEDWANIDLKLRERHSEPQEETVVTESLVNGEAHPNSDKGPSSPLPVPDSTELSLLQDLHKQLRAGTCELEKEEIEFALSKEANPRYRRIGSGTISGSFVFEVKIRGVLMALKMIQPKENAPQLMNHLKSEVEGLLRFRHSRILALSGFNFIENPQGVNVFLLYPLMESGTLDCTLHYEKESVLSALRRIAICRGVAEALAFIANDKPYGAYHGDISSRNVLLDARLQPCLADFGAFGRVDGQGNPIRADGYHLFTGTPGYICPEAIAGPKADVFSFGVLLMETWLNRPALDKDTGTSLVPIENMNCLAPSVDYKGWRKDVHSGLMHLAHSCTQSVRERRPKMDDVLVQLNGALQLNKSN